MTLVLTRRIRRGHIVRRGRVLDVMSEVIVNNKGEMLLVSKKERLRKSPAALQLNKGTVFLQTSSIAPQLPFCGDRRTVCPKVSNDFSC